MIRIGICLCLLLPLPAGAEERVFPALSGAKGASVLVYSSLDERLATPMIAGFQALHPDVTVRYDELLTGEIYDRILAETANGGVTADFAFSSAMDLQMKLANDGYAQVSPLPDSAEWPVWANWRDTAYALTFEPAVIVYNRAAFAGAGPPETRAALAEHLAGQTDAIGTYDIERSGLGYLFLARDQEHFPDIWSLIRVMGRAQVQLFPTSQDILERVTEGQLVLGYNILGSYAVDWARDHPGIGVILPRDHTVVVSRIGLVPRAAGEPALGRDFLEWFMSVPGQSVLSRDLGLGAVNPALTGPDTASGMQADFGPQLRPVPVSPGLLVYLDQEKRAKLIARWTEALSAE